MLGRRRLGHRALLHRLRAARQRHDLGHVRGRAGLPGQGHLVGGLRASYDVTLFYTAPTAIRACMKWGAEPREARPLLAAPARHGRRADQPEGVALVPPRDQRRALPIVDTWWRTDGRVVISPTAGLTETKPGSASTHCRASTRASSTRRRADAGTDQGLQSRSTRPWPGMLRTLYGDHDCFIETWTSSAATSTSSDDRPRGRRRVLPRHRARRRRAERLRHRMSTAEIESAIVSHSKVAEAAVISAQDEDTGQSVAAFVTLEGTQEGSDGWSTRSASTSASGSANSPAPSASSGPTTCPRRARQDHAPAPARHRRGPRARRRHDAARPRRHGAARAQGQGAPGRRG